MYTSEVAAPPRAVFAWHRSPGALQALIPPWEQVSIEQSPPHPPGLVDGAVAVLIMRVGPLKQRWVAHHRDVIDRGDAGGEFTDEQVKGPFASWVHRHVIEPALGTTAASASTPTSPPRTRLTDHIEYRLPLSWLGQACGGWLVRRKLRRMFAFRHEATRRAVESAASKASLSEGSA